MSQGLPDPSVVSEIWELDLESGAIPGSTPRKSKGNAWTKQATEIMRMLEWGDIEVHQAPTLLKAQQEQGPQNSIQSQHQYILNMNK